MTSRKWEGILEKIAGGFEAYEKMQWEDGLDHQSKEYKKLQRKWSEGRKLFIEYYNDLWD